MDRPPAAGRRGHRGGLPILAILGPGLLLAATGVGAGDLLTASLAGSRYGYGILWAAWVGALLKWFLNEGIARWQMATGTTLLEGWVGRLGRWIRWVFLAYLLLWSFFTGGALVSACGVAGAAMLPLSTDPSASKILWGIVHSLAGGVLVWFGGFRLFERLMALCVGVMFAAVMATAVLTAHDWTLIARGLVAPSIPPGGAAYVLGVLGGVGGTLTLLSYGYWIREKGRTAAPGLSVCRIDLAAAYLITALFGMAMIVIGSGLRLEKGPETALELAGQLRGALGPAGGWIFLIGFWGAVFSSLLGVWQSAPYLFADFLTLSRSAGGRRTGTESFPSRTEAERVARDHPGERAASGEAGGHPAEDPNAELSRSPAYRFWLILITTVPLPLLWVPLRKAQLSYAVFGSLFMPLLALTLLIMNNREGWVGRGFRNGALFNAVLALTLIFFVWLAVTQSAASLRGLVGAG